MEDRNQRETFWWYISSNSLLSVSIKFYNLAHAGGSLKTKSVSSLLCSVFCNSSHVPQHFSTLTGKQNMSWLSWSDAAQSFWRMRSSEKVWSSSNFCKLYSLWELDYFNECCYQPRSRLRVFHGLAVRDVERGLTSADIHGFEALLQLQLPSEGSFLHLQVKTADVVEVVCFHPYQKHWHLDVWC